MFLYFYIYFSIVSETKHTSKSRWKSKVFQSHYSFAKSSPLSPSDLFCYSQHSCHPTGGAQETQMPRQLPRHSHMLSLLQFHMQPQSSGWPAPLLGGQLRRRGLLLLVTRRTSSHMPWEGCPGGGHIKGGLGHSPCCKLPAHPWLSSSLGILPCPHYPTCQTPQLSTWITDAPSVSGLYLVSTPVC